LTSNPAALQRWMIAGPEVAHLVQEFEATAFDVPQHLSKSHHEHHFSF